MKTQISAFFNNLFGQKASGGCVGIALYPTSVRLVKLLPNEEQALTCVDVRDYPLERPELLPALLAHVISEMSLQHFKCVFVIPPDKVESVQIEMSEMPTIDVHASLPWKLKDLVSIPPQDMICDYIEMDVQPFGQPVKAQVMATSKAYIEMLLAPFHKAKVPVHAITTEQFVIAKLQTVEDAAQLVFVQHTDSTGILLILKNQQICFARKIRGTDAVVNMLPEEVKEYGADMIAIEIQRSVDYYESQLKQPPIKDVIISIAGGNEALICEVLNTNLPVKTRIANLTSDIQDDTGEISLQYLAALGGALYANQEEAQ